MTWVAFSICLLVSFVFAGVEAGLLSINWARLRGRVRAGDRAAMRLERLLSQPERLLATVLLVTNFADVGALVVVTDALVQRFGSPNGYVVTLVCMLPVYLVGVQLLPKSLFRRFPYRALAGLAGLLEATSWLLQPVLWLGGTLASSLMWARTKPTARGVFVAREELKRLAAEGERAGALTSTERGMIHTVVDFRGVLARDVMRPLPAVFRIEGGVDGAGAPRVADLITFATAQKVDCVAVEAPAPSDAGNGGNVSPKVGLRALIDPFTLLLERDPHRSVAAYLRRPPVVVKPDDAAYHIIRRLRTARSLFAAVVEGGRPIGYVRSRDLIDRLVQGAAAS